MLCLEKLVMDNERGEKNEDAVEPVLREVNDY